jgi:DNA-binding MarR family transcriptional regulator
MIDLVERIVVASVALTARALAETAGSELTFLGWRTLVIVGSSDGAIRLSELADGLSLSRPSASKLVHRMAGRDLLALERDPIDRRGLCLRLGREGARLRSAVMARRRQLLAESLEGIGPVGSGTIDLGEIAVRLDKWI